MNKNINDQLFLLLSSKYKKAIKIPYEGTY